MRVPDNDSWLNRAARVQSGQEVRAKALPSIERVATGIGSPSAALFHGLQIVSGTVGSWGKCGGNRFSVMPSPMGGYYAMSTLSGPDDHNFDERAILCRRGGGVALPALW